MKKMRPKIKCEICGLQKKTILHRHHIIPRIDPRSTNDNQNIAIICPNCHSLVHSGDIIIIGMYQTTDGMQLIWFRKDEEPPLLKDFWQVKENPLVITMGGELDDLEEE